jgi:hypothetical protein
MKALYDAASKLVPAGAVGASTTGSLVSEKREAWTEAHKPEAPTQEVAGTLTKSADERKAALDRTLASRGAQGWRIENRSDFQATIATGKPVHHVLHLILTILTAGLWAIVWIIVAITGGIKRHLITIDEYGNIAEQKI